MAKSLIDLCNWPLVLGIDVGGTQIRASVLQGDKLLSRVGLLSGKDSTPDEIILRIYHAIEQAINEADVILEQIAGIGIGIAGLIDSHTGLVFTLTNLPGWHNVPLRDIFEKHFGIPTVIENDVNAAALGEYLFGHGRDARSMVYFVISTGIGGGIINDGQLVRGVSGTAAELGHMTIDWHGRRCSCGNIGCLESIASGTAIARRANEAIADGLGDDLLPWATIRSRGDEQAHHDKSRQQFFIDAQGIARAAEQGVPLACEIIKDAATAIGIGLVNIIHLFNPDMIVLAGGVTQIGSLLIEPALRIVQERTMEVPARDVRVVSTQLGADFGIIGAGALNFLSRSPKERKLVDNPP